MCSQAQLQDKAHLVRFDADLLSFLLGILVSVGVCYTQNQKHALYFLVIRCNLFFIKNVQPTATDKE